jgi:prepilin-type N-terminal cleavage/methylation domain-containing protein
MNNKKKAFTLIELLVVIAIIALVATIAIVSLQQARSSARDAKRIADIKQIQTALELYFNDAGQYPDDIVFGESLSFSGNTYMEKVPQAPTPADGNCLANQNFYQYIVGNNNASYEINFCLGSQVGSLSAGLKTAIPSGIIDFFDPLSVCINPNPGFENTIESPDYWSLYGMKIEGGDFVQSIEHAPILVNDASDGSKAVKLQGDTDRYSMIFSEDLELEDASYTTLFEAKGNGLFSLAYTINNMHYWNFSSGQWDLNVANPFDPNYMRFYFDIGSSYIEQNVSGNNVSVPTGALEGEKVTIMFVSESSDVYIDNIRLLKNGVENILLNPSFENYNFFPFAWRHHLHSDQPEGYVLVENNPSHVYSGSYSMKLGVGATTPGSGSVEIMADITLEESNNLNLSFFAKTSLESNSNTMSVWVRNDNHDYYYDFSTETWVSDWHPNDFSLTNNFEEYIINDISPPPTGNMTLFVFTPDFGVSDSFFWIDNVCITYSE